MSKPYNIAWTLNDRQPKTAIKQAISDLKTLESQAKKTIGAVEGIGTHLGSSVQNASKAVGNGFRDMNGHTAVLASGVKEATSRMNGHIKTGVSKDVTSYKSGNKVRVDDAEKTASRLELIADRILYKDEKKRRAHADAMKRQSDSGVIHDQKSFDKRQSQFSKGLDKLTRDNKKALDQEVNDTKKANDKKEAADQKSFDKKFNAFSKSLERGSATRKRAIEKDAADEERFTDAVRLREWRKRNTFERQKQRLEEGPYIKRSRFLEQTVTEEQAHLIARNNAHRSYSNKRINEIMKERHAIRDNFRESISDAIGFERAVSAAGLAIMGLQAGKTVIQGIANSFIEARKQAQAFGETTLDFMVRLRPLASVVGRTPDIGFAKEVAQFGVDTGMGKEKAATFMESFSGRAQITKGKQISDQEYEKFQTAAGKMATARGIPPEIAGDLFASVLKLENFKAKGQGSKEALGRANAGFEILDAGTGKMEKLLPQAQEMVASLASENELEGVFKNFGEVAVMTSLMAENKPEEAAVFGRATIKALSQFDDKDRQPFYKEAGIVPGMPALERVQRANAIFEKKTAEGIPMEKVLSDAGLAGDVREKTGLLTAFKARNTVLKPQLERLKSLEGQAGADKAEKFIDKRFKDQDIQFTVAKAQNEQAEISGDTTDAKIFREKAEAKLKEAERKNGPALRMVRNITGAFNTLMQIGSIGAFGHKTGRETMVDAMALDLAKRQAGQKPGTGFFEATNGDTDAQIKLLIEAMNRNTAANERAAKIADAQRLGGPPNVAPIPAPLAPVGAGNGARR